MKKLIMVVMTSFLFLSPLHAEWTKFGETVASDIYVDFDRLEKQGDNLLVWELWSQRDPTWPLTTLFSSLYFQKIHCHLGSVKMVRMIDYMEGMAQGEPEEQDDTKFGWRIPYPGSLEERVIQYICEHAENMPKT